MNYSQRNLAELTAKARSIRRQVLDMCVAYGGHLASSLSCTDILVVLYQGGILRVDPAHPDAPDRDRFFLSKGHAETVLYAVLADCGFFPPEWIETSYRHGDCRLGGHPSHLIPGVEISSGSLGHGLGLAAGQAIAAHAGGLNHRHIVLMGDAECTEGSVWEAAMFASRHNLANLTAIVDWNGIGSLDFTDRYTGLEPFAEKWRAFGWEVREVDGHDMVALEAALRPGQESEAECPVVVLARTVKGKGVSFVENDPAWHVRKLRKDEALRAKGELA